MSSPAWIPVTSQENIPLREGRVVQVGAREIAIFNLGSRVLAVDNRCPHRGGPLSDGILAGSSVVCPLHGWKVCLTSGNVTLPSTADACVVPYPTRIEGGIIYLALPTGT